MLRIGITLFSQLVCFDLEVLREVGGLHEGIGGEETADDGVVEAGVGVDDLEAVVMLMAGEAAMEGERDLGLMDNGLVHDFQINFFKA